ncbi:hypothetical protein H2203_002226 [Taxawa tesnikishii (nom. ined.)]|nr:hypothetical protein H2203_002226 [Dothideales sp. JES 119]
MVCTAVIRFKHSAANRDRRFAMKVRSRVKKWARKMRTWPPWRTASGDRSREEEEESDDDDSITDNTTGSSGSTEPFLDPTAHITEEALVRLAITERKKFWLGDDDDITATHSRIASGSFNRVRFISFSDGKEVCIRIPYCGYDPAWTAHDAVALRNQVLLLKYIKRKTNLPVPEILSYDATLNNGIGTPYTIMNVIKGREIQSVWHEGNGVVPLEGFRQHVLQSVANAMAELRHLHFPKAGALHFPNDEDGEPEIGNVWRPGSADREFGFEPEDYMSPPSDSSEVEIRKDLERWWNNECQEPISHGAMADMLKGIRMMYELILDQFPFKHVVDQAGGERFSLKPPDFDWQNILVDDEGNVTGFLDWDYTVTVPAFMGWCIYPYWLMEDWQEEYSWPKEEAGWGISSSPDELERYRNDYARYMRAACGDQGDCRFTSKSHLYQTASAVLSAGSARTVEFMEKVVWTVLPRVRTSLVLDRLGQHGWALGQKEYMSEKLRALFAPENVGAPQTETLVDVE